ncbi:MAG: SAM-dependent DNA methyltransferase, partial [Deltaproteobacteria bacterium]|nr:SAM-dependent DNA methyltransferase [Deltaproteobacteria bacterium]
MPPLTKQVRNQLEAAVTSARETAEAGARSALDYLGVACASPPAYLDEVRRGLRDRLRLHGRQLGDRLKGDTPWTMDRLVEETAYEHWHRMFFARFLEAKDLLIYRSSGGPVPVTLEDCESLAPMEKAEDGREFAERCAARMLPGIFRAGSPAFELLLPPESRQDLAKIIADLPPEVFEADDSLGWCYQHHQSRRKNEINASEVKIGERELPSVTQLFSEPYMVGFLLDNTLGAWWATRKLSGADLATAGNEDELRRRIGLPGAPLAWLRFVRDGEGPWTPAAGTFARWPDRLADFRMLDPCCGSGHFLVAAFKMLVPMRMADE